MAQGVVNLGFETLAIYSKLILQFTTVTGLFGLFVILFAVSGESAEF